MKGTNLSRCPNGHFYDPAKFDVCPHCETTKDINVTQIDWTLDRSDASFGTSFGQIDDNAISASIDRLADNAALTPSAAESRTVFEAQDDFPMTVPLDTPKATDDAAFSEQWAGELSVQQNEPDTPAARPAKQTSPFVGGYARTQDDSMTIQYYQKTLGTEPVVGWLVCVKGVHRGEDFRIKAGRNFLGRGGSMDICLSGDTAVSREKHLIVTYDPKHNMFFAQPGDTSILSYLNDKPLLEVTTLNAGDKLSAGESDLIFVPFCGELYTWEN
ncbi:MAG: hypothetical protein IJT44_11580 [Clostridia bacterium]|nr:hypothetical protein [Clostridia bacterium]